MPDLTFAHPERLWLLLALPLLLWLLIPPRPRRVVYTAHLPQWHAALAGLKRKRPRAVSWRTLLTLLAATAALLAILGLAVRGRAGPSRLVVLFDGSASMAAHGAFEAAAARCKNVMAALPETVDVRVLRCGGPVLRRHGESARQLHDIGAPAGTQTVDLATLAAGLAAPDTVVWTLSDGHGDAPLPTAGALTLVGARGVNVAVLDVRIEDHWPLPELVIEADVVGFGPESLPVIVTLDGAVEGVLPAQDLELRSGEPVTVSWSARRSAAGGEVSVTIETGAEPDPLPDDDRWSALLPPLPAPRIAVLADAEAGPFARVAATALAAEVEGSVVPASAGATVSMLLVDGGELGLVPGTARALCFGTRLTGLPATGGEARPVAVAAIDWDRSTPLLTGLDLSELRLERALPELLPAGPGVTPFLWTATGPLSNGAAGAAERTPLAVTVDGVGPDGEPSASLHFAFRLADSNLALLPAFPQLLRRAFVLSHRERAEPRRLTAPPAVGEQDLWRRQTAPDRPLPAFATPDRGLGSWLLLAGAVALLLRAFVRR